MAYGDNSLAGVAGGFFQQPAQQQQQQAPQPAPMAAPLPKVQAPAQAPAQPWVPKFGGGDNGYQAPLKLQDMNQGQYIKSQQAFANNNLRGESRAFNAPVGPDSYLYNDLQKYKPDWGTVNNKQLLPQGWYNTAEEGQPFASSVDGYQQVATGDSGVNPGFNYNYKPTDLADAAEWLGASGRPAPVNYDQYLQANPGGNAMGYGAHAQPYFGAGTPGRNDALAAANLDQYGWSAYDDIDPLTGPYGQFDWDFISKLPYGPQNTFNGLGNGGSDGPTAGAAAAAAGHGHFGGGDAVSGSGNQGPQ